MQKGSRIVPSLPVGSYGSVEFSFRDQWNKIGTQKFFAKAITAANHDAQITLANAYRDAAIAVCLGTLSRWAYGDEYVVSSAIPDNGAFRKIKLSIGYWDTTTFQKFQTTLP